MEVTREHGSDVEDEAGLGHLLEPIARCLSERNPREGWTCKGEAGNTADCGEPKLPPGVEL